MTQNQAREDRNPTKTTEETGSGWQTFRPSVPAEYVDGIPDEAAVWKAWTDNVRTITVYGTGNEFYVVYSLVKSHGQDGPYTSKNRAMARAKSLREPSPGDQYLEATYDCNHGFWSDTDDTPPSKCRTCGSSLFSVEEGTY